MSVEGSFRDFDKVKELASICDVITVEIEHVDVNALDSLQKTNPAVHIRPSPDCIRIIQNKHHYWL